TRCDSRQTRISRRLHRARERLQVRPANRSQTRSFQLAVCQEIRAAVVGAEWHIFSQVGVGERSLQAALRNHSIARISKPECLVPIPEPARDLLRDYLWLPKSLRLARSG